MDTYDFKLLAAFEDQIKIIDLRKTKEIQSIKLQNPSNIISCSFSQHYWDNILICQKDSYYIDTHNLVAEKVVHRKRISEEG